MPAALLSDALDIVASNAGFRQFTGLTAGALGKLTLLDLVHPEQRVALRERLEELRRGKAKSAEIDVEFRSAAGEDRPSVLIAQRIGQRKKQLLAYVVDLTHLTSVTGMHAELLDVIEHAKWEWRQTFDAVETPIVILAGDGTISRINRAARMLVGRDYGEIVGHSVRKLPDSEPWVSIAALATEVQQRRSPSARQVKDSFGRTLDLLAMLFNTDDPADQHVIVIVWDVTALVDLQSSLEQQRTMATMGALVAGVAHEVRNPLFAISATIDAMEQAAGGALSEYFEVLRDEIERMTALMRDLLAYGRPAAPVFGTIAIREVVDAACRGSSALAARQQVGLKSEIRANPNVVADRDRLSRAVQNVVDNALQHAPAGSEVTIDCTTAAQGRSRNAVITIADRGRGFAPDDLARLFEPFFSRRKGGTGLGLALVQQIVTEHGGTVTATNREGGGAEIVISLPLPRE